MLKFSPGKIASQVFLDELDRLKCLVEDMEKIAVGVEPGQIVTGRKTPTLNNWAAATRNVCVLTGVASGHPLLPGDDRSIVTSSLWLIAVDGSWARTRSRWYRLGEERTTTGCESVHWL